MSISRLTSSPPCLPTVVLLIPHQLQLSLSLRLTLAHRSSRQRTAQALRLLTDLSPAHVLLCWPLPSASVRASLQYNTQPLVAALPAVVGAPDHSHGQSCYQG